MAESIESFHVSVLKKDNLETLMVQSQAFLMHKDALRNARVFFGNSPDGLWRC